VRSGRDPASVRLIAVTKGRTAQLAQEVVSLGFENLGENRVQEAQEKIPYVSAGRWHMIGHLQTNKVGAALRLFHAIHSLDRLDLASALDRRGCAIPLYVEVNLAEDPARHGFPPADVLDAVSRVRAQFPRLSLVGLMGMAPFDPNPEAARPFFRTLRGLRERCGLPELSMGMSGDFEIAVEEGATVVRVGTALFEGI
jgi:pyridoxal phosphate enzyme (YggS family)